MFSFDENGNVLIDTEQSDAITRATSNRTISARATALTRGQYVPINPITASTLQPFLTSLGERYKAVCNNLRGGASRIAYPRSPSDLDVISNRAVADWVSVELQGFEGPLPILEVEGVRTIDFLLPADGAVIRYLGRLLHNSKGLVHAEIVVNGDRRPSAVRTLDASEAVNPNGDHTMRLRIFMRYSHGTSGRFENAVPDTLVALLKMMDIEEEFPALPRVLRTLSRKLRSTTGNWGEEPRFPVVNFRGKMDGYMSNGRVELSLIHHLFHGNRSQMYSDKSVYAVMDENMKQPLLATKPITSTGAAQWITPA